MSFENHKKLAIGILGLGKTGKSAYEILKSSVTIICYDDIEASRDSFAQIYGVDDIVEINDPRWTALDKIILSPGVPLSHNIVKIANHHNIVITSDIDLFFEQSPFSNFISVTGTNGKSTTSALIHHIFQFSGLDYKLGGNVGIPILSLNPGSIGYVTELSSFQLDLIKNFKSKIAVLLNITPDHLDRHSNMENYIKSKKKIFDRMDQDSFAIINIDNEITKNIFYDLQKEDRINVIPFSVLTNVNNGISIIDNIIYDNIFEEIKLELPNNKFLQGLHNKENVAASYGTCRILDVIPSQIVDAIALFKGLAHRMEYIGSIKHVNFYNDSKATNSESASKSLSSFDNIYWLLGGIAKEGGIASLDFSCLKNVHRAYIFGQDKELFASSLNGKTEFKICEDLEEAFNSALSDAIDDKNDANILLAPAASSYDQFKNFEERGERFIRLYRRYVS